MTYYEARKKINKLKDKVADEKAREALRIAAEVLLDRYDSVGPYYDGEEFTCPKCRNHVAPDDLYCSQMEDPMTNEEALKIAEQSLAAFEFVPEAYNVEYTKLCAAAIEKQIAKETADTFVCGDFGRAVSYGHCPTCGAFACGDAYNFCPKCGQKLDWKEEKEKEK